MVDDDALKKAEQLGYSRGYAAGKRRKSELRHQEHLARQHQAFLDRAFLAALPAAITSDGWKTADGKVILNIMERTELAWDFAVAALKQRRIV